MYKRREAYQNIYMWFGQSGNREVKRKSNKLRFPFIGLDFLMRKRILDAELHGQKMERQRIAGELHDSLSQELLLMKIYVETIGKLASDPQQTELHIKKLKNQVDQSLYHVRSLSHDISERDRMEQPFSERIVLMSKKINELKGLRINVETSGIKSMLKDAHTDHYLFCVVQEFVQNSMKHGKATNIGIFLGKTLSGYKLKLIDDGCGFDQEHVVFSFGLTNIESRLKKIGANYNLKSLIGQGTEMSIEISA